MQYKVKFIYFDGKDVDLILDENKIKGFFEKLNAGEIYWNDENMMRGFWLNLEKIRYIEFFGIKAPEEEKIDEQAEDNRSEVEVLPENAGDSIPEGEPEPA